MGQIREAVAKIGDLQDGQMQQVCVGDTPVLLAKIEGEFQAMGAHCVHYGAPLAKGYLSGDRVVCPWHHACYHVATGAGQEPPGLNDLPRFTVEIEGEDVIVTVPEAAPSECMPALASADLNVDNRVFVILGAGAAGLHAAETLRKEGFRGRVVMVTAAEDLPIDRPKLSKQYLQGKAGENALPLRDREFYKRYDIEVLTETRAVKVNARDKHITFADNTSLDYDRILLATGGRARQLDVPGAELENIFTLRNHQDGDRILDAAQKAENALIIGSSFIGMEVAASLRQQGVKVAVISSSDVPLAKILGPDVGNYFREKHEENGVCFQFNAKVKEFKGKDKVETAILERGTPIEVDLVVVGIGVDPATDYLEGIKRNADGSISTNSYLQASDSVFVAGDIARFPYWQTGEPTRIEHWRLAAQQGRIAAHNMLNQAVPFRSVPFFWTGQFDIKLRYVGHATQWDDCVIDGDLDAGEFIAYYLKGDRVLAAAGCNRDAEMAAIEELMRLGKMPKIDDLRELSVEKGKLNLKAQLVQTRS
jgi:NADPH-dependent 2,4-dienoyl-CoA reductase/sulfur reductase-like enzyme/nitrite reductase/ring-hydroxylating ferredoxin subunit